MARETQPTYPRLSARLGKEIGRINFYRFCQLLEKSMPERSLLGSSLHPADDPVRFRPHPGMGFPVSELKAIEYDDDAPDAPPTVRTTFLGLYGVDSPLPTSYLDDITQRREGHEALEGFLDIFNHRILTQFYRIWRKHAYPASFEAGGKDATSQCLLGLIGLGITGTDKHVATPVSRFLALLGVMRRQARTAEGIEALVRLLAPQTHVGVTPHCLRPVTLNQPMGFYGEGGFLLDGCTVLGEEATDANSQLLIALYTEDAQEAQAWLPEGQLYHDFQVLLRVYLGWRYKARITLTVPTPLLPEPVLGREDFLLGLTGVLGTDDKNLASDIPPAFTVVPGHYCGLPRAVITKGNRRVAYHF